MVEATFNPNSYTMACIAAREHAIAAYPNEACGLILKDGSYVALDNVAANPRQQFDCSEGRVPYILAGVVASMVHSHPYEKTTLYSTETPHDFGPSAHDMVQQIADGFPWGVIATNGIISSPVLFWGETIEPVALRGRQFRHGPTGTDGKGDCYALIKDYYKQELNIVLPEGPRDYEWWVHNENLYLDNIMRAGFIVIPSKDAVPGDVFLAQINSAVPNHGGVLLDQGLLLHHLSNRVSREEPLVGWRRHIVTWIRHKER